MIVDGRTVLPQLAPMLRVLTLPAGSNQRAVMHCLITYRIFRTFRIGGFF
jgi:hypothetical protein